MQPDVTPFFTIATTSSGLPNIAIRFWKEHCASGYEPSFGRSARNWGYRSSRAFCPKSMSTCSSRYHRISRSATSFDVSKGARRIAFRWSSQTFANVTGVAISGRGATSALPAATAQTRRYFSISSIMKLPASAGSYSVLHKWKKFFCRSRVVYKCPPFLCGGLVFLFRLDPIAGAATKMPFLPERRLGFKINHQKSGGGKSRGAMCACRNHENNWLARPDQTKAMDRDNAFERPAGDGFKGHSFDLGFRHSGIVLDFE